MLRRDLLGALMATPLTGWLRPWVSTAFGGGALQATNAAALYENAFDWVEGLRPEDSERLHQAAKSATLAFDDPQINGLIRSAGPALEAMREAAAITRCQWQVELLTFDDLGKGHLRIANANLIRAACLSARHHASCGQGRAALDETFAALTLAHRIGTGGALIARIMEYSGEFLTFQTLGLILPELDQATLDEFLRRLETLPAPEPAAATIGPESRFILGSIRAKLQTMGPSIQNDDWGELGFGPEEAAMLERLTKGDREAIDAHLEATRPAFAELARRLDLPRSGCRAALDEFAEAERSVHPVALSPLENAWHTRCLVDRMRAQRAMLRAGLFLIRDGEPAFRQVADPFGFGPFVLERRGTRCLLRSALHEEGRPDVILEIGVSR